MSGWDQKACDAYFEDKYQCDDEDDVEEYEELEESLDEEE